MIKKSDIDNLKTSKDALIASDDADHQITILSNELTELTQTREAALLDQNGAMIIELDQSIKACEVQLEILQKVSELIGDKFKELNFDEKASERKQHAVKKRSAAMKYQKKSLDILETYVERVSEIKDLIQELSKIDDLITAANDEIQSFNEQSSENIHIETVKHAHELFSKAPVTIPAVYEDYESEKPIYNWDSGCGRIVGSEKVISQKLKHHARHIPGYVANILYANVINFPDPYSDGFL